MTFRSDATEGVWSPTQNVAVQTEANVHVVAIFFFHQCGFLKPFLNGKILRLSERGVNSILTTILQF